MITPKDIEKKTMTPEKRKSSKNDFFAFYIGRPITYILTVPFLYTRLSPDTISLLSIIPSIIGFFLMGLGIKKSILLLGWFCFFFWSLMDGVDGNVARYRKKFSPLGEAYDAMGGYAATALIFLSFGWAGSHFKGIVSYFVTIPEEMYIVLGALSAIFALFPRLVMHRAITTLGDKNAISELTDKADYGMIKIIGLNLVSTSGFIQIIMPIAVIFNMMDLFTVGYCLMNFLVMLVSLKSIFCMR